MKNLISVISVFLLMASLAFGADIKNSDVLSDAVPSGTFPETENDKNNVALNHGFVIWAISKNAF